MPPETTGYNGMVRNVEFFLHRSLVTHTRFSSSSLMMEGGTIIFNLELITNDAQHWITNLFTFHRMKL
jgi:hypothetical protein